MAESAASPQRTPGEHQSALLEFLRAPSPQEKAAVLQRCPWLVTEAADYVLSQLAAVQTDPNVREYIQAHRERLAQLRSALADAGPDPRFGDGDRNAELRCIFEELDRPAAISAMPHRVQLCERALQLVERAAAPQLWAELQDELANSLAQTPQGSRAENLERAISCYERALEVRTREALPMEWAGTQVNLGNAYKDRIRGERAENVERAIGCYERALEVRTREALPVEWAGTQMNLGTAYQVRIRGKRAENVERAIGCYERALEVRTREALPVEWAGTQVNLGIAYKDRIRGERAENAELAIGCYERALEVRTREALPVDWAETQNNLAIAYRGRIRGERAENMERAISCYERALEVRTREALPVDWAVTQMNLGAAYQGRIRGERAQNVDRAIGCYERALEVMTREALPVEWATTQNNLGSAYEDRIRGERAENVECAIGCYERALEVRTREVLPVEWAQTQNNLGNAYGDRIRGERAENVECAIGCYERALEVRTQEALPVEWAQTQNNLGIAYGDRIRGERGDNVERAMSCYERALEVMTREALPVDWAQTQMNLGGAYLHRVRGERAENVERAISCYERALEVRSREALPVDWATTQMNLGSAYRHRIRDERAENVERAISCYERALEVITREALPVDWATTQNNLGNAYRHRIQGAHAENVGSAIVCYERALEVMTREALPRDHRDVQRNLQLLTFQEERWGQAAAASLAILAAHELLYLTAPTPEARQRLLGEVRDVSALLAYAHCRLGDAHWPQAVLALENGRARFLAETLELDEAPLDDARPEDRSAFETARAELNRLQALARLPEDQPSRPTFIHLSERLSAAWSELNTVTSRIRAYLPDWMPKTSFRDIQAAAQASPIAYLAVTERGGLALIVRRDGAVDPVWLPALTGDALVQELRRHFNAYADSRTEWHDALDATLQWCWRAVMEPLLSKLDGEDEAVLIPGGLLGLLPLHASYTVDGTARRYAMDAVRLRYAPSARALHSAARSAAHIAPGALLAIDQPQPVSGNPLPNSAREVDAALSHFPNAGLRLPGAEASLDAVRARMPEYPVLHFSCHGFTNFAKPLEGGLVLAQDNVLTLRHFLDAKLPRARLAILSACETGIPGTELPDEVISLPAALMQAGVDGVIGSLWSVADISTMMLMARFYEYWKGEGNAPPQALRAAQQWVRDTSLDEKREFFKSRLPEFAGANRITHETADWLFKAIALTDIDFSHPFHWAAFCYVGV